MRAYEFIGKHELEVPNVHLCNQRGWQIDGLWRELERLARQLMRQHKAPQVLTTHPQPIFPACDIPEINRIEYTNQRNYM